jgi:hypothetical protein
LTELTGHALVLFALNFGAELACFVAKMVGIATSTNRCNAVGGAHIVNGIVVVLTEIAGSAMVFEACLLRAKMAICAMCMKAASHVFYRCF